MPIKDSKFSITKEKVFIFFLLFLSVEFLPFLASVAQTTPLCYFLCILLIPFSLKKIEFTPILKLLITYILYALLITLFYFAKEIFSNSLDVVSLRLVNFIRQIVALLLGLLLFITIRKVIQQIGIEVFLRYAIYSIIPISGYILIVDIPEYILEGDSSYRIMGYFSEPSHCSEFIVLIVFGSMYLYTGLEKKMLSNKKLFFFFIIGLLIIILSSSGTGLIRLILLIMGIVIFEDSKKFKIIFLSAMTLVFIGIGYFFYASPESYLTHLLVSISIDKDQSASFVDRYYSFIGPISNIFESKISIGYGLGGDSIYYKEFYPNQFIELIKLVKDGGFNIVSFWGKILVYTGIAGMIIWGVIVFKAFSIIKKIKPYYKIGAILFCIFIYGFVGSGAFLLVYIWFWLAVVDFIYISKSKKITETGESN